MAYDWLSIAKRIEATYPQAIGGATRDDVLRSRLVPWFNDVLIELDLMQRWSYEFVTNTQLTTSGVATYPLPTGMTTIKYVYYVTSSSQPRYLRKFDTFELGKVYGSPTSPSESPGAPVTYSLDNRTITIFPNPDLSGNDSGGNFLLYFVGYQVTPPIIETTGTTTAASPILTVPSTAYVTGQGNVVDGAAISVRGAGNLGAGGVASDLVTTASTIATTATTSTLATSAITAVTAAQTFYNSQPWVIQWWPKLAEFGVLREVASYLQDNAGYQTWEARYQHEIELLRAQEVDRTMNLEIFAAAHVGQYDSELRRSDDTLGYDYRGGGNA